MHPTKGKSAVTAWVMTVDPDRPTISATWASMYCDVSRTVTSVASIEHAHGLCWWLTELSKNAWEVTAWLDTAPAIETAIRQLDADLRGTGDIGEPAFDLTGCRHADAEATGGVQAASTKVWLASSTRWAGYSGS